MINIYVGNLPYNTQEQDLIEHFGQWGEVDQATLVFDRETGRPRGFGFVEMVDPQEAQIAIESAHGELMNGRPLTVNQARPRGSGRTDNPTLTRTAVAHAETAPATASHGYANASAHPSGYHRYARADVAETPRYSGPPKSQQGGYSNYVYGQAS